MIPDLITGFACGALPTVAMYVGYRKQCGATQSAEQAREGYAASHEQMRQAMLKAYRRMDIALHTANARARERNAANERAAAHEKWAAESDAQLLACQQRERDAAAVRSDRVRRGNITRRLRREQA